MSEQTSRRGFDFDAWLARRVEEWHDAESGIDAPRDQSLPDYLGMTGDEYAAFVEQRPLEPAPPQPQTETSEPWEADLCFTIRAESDEAVDQIMDELNRLAAREGQPQGFTDYSGPQKGGFDDTHS